MTRAFQASMLLYNPEIVFVLGELPYLFCFKKRVSQVCKPVSIGLDKQNIFSVK